MLFKLKNSNKLFIPYLIKTKKTLYLQSFCQNQIISIDFTVNFASLAQLVEQFIRNE